MTLKKGGFSLLQQPKDFKRKQCLTDILFKFTVEELAHYYNNYDLFFIIILTRIEVQSFS